MTQTVRRGRIGQPKIVKERPGAWTIAVRNQFLNVLTATCNVHEACRVVSRNYSGAYALRRRDQAFAEQWRAAIEAGWDRLEEALLEHALAPLSDRQDAADTASKPFDSEGALKLLAQRRVLAGRAQSGKVGRPAPRWASREETDAAILKALAQIGKRLART